MHVLLEGAGWGTSAIRYPRPKNNGKHLRKSSVAGQFVAILMSAQIPQFAFSVCE
jgi:hypothetical protein